MAENRLGRGLDALLSDNKSDAPARKQVVENIYIDDISPNPFQPRKNFDRDALNELAQSIESNGVIQPITLRMPEPEKYQLVSGERRWRAAKIAGLKKIPAIIKEYTDEQMMEVALIENLQREDLNPIEEAQAFKRMLDEFNMTQVEVSEKVGRSRSSVANSVRLLNLAPKVQMYVSRETLSVGHARALLSLKSKEKQLKAADFIIKNHLSVRETEKYVSRIKQGEGQQKKKKPKKKKQQLDIRWKKAEKKLSSCLNKTVKIKQGNGKNKKIVAIECREFKDIQDILNKIIP